MISWKVYLTLWCLVSDNVTPVASAFAHYGYFDCFFLACHVTRFVLGMAHVDGVAHRKIESNAIAHEAREDVCAIVVFGNVHDAIQCLVVIKIGTDDFTHRGTGVFYFDRSSVQGFSAHDFFEFGSREIKTVVRIAFAAGVAHSQEKRCECFYCHK